MFRLSRIKKHLTPATVLAFVALIFAITGGAFAATGNGGGSGSPKASASTGVATAAKAKPKGKAGPRGPAGKNGTNGAPGATGPAGPAGPTGATGAAGTGTAGATGATGPAGPQGKEGPVGPPGPKGENGVLHKGETLPSEASETGTWMITTSAAQTKELVQAHTAISFPIPLELALSENNVFFIPPNEEGTVDGTQCPGSVAEPLAAKGDLCVYTRAFGGGLTTTGSPISNPSEGTQQAGAGTTGALLNFEPKNEEQGLSFGTWAVTAP